ncbi:GGDEF domain-containing protein [Roseomonas sp. PWR1]|uniref:diguanylate cyclase n=1 Tax=Roseomonas nitratireducens TaxID=2820810 RepID=A0ABS4B080_9PROT|nr:GGDEF domain-containing protein [Neoroseomonas nitratireducens]MBP0467034.1 GGDEF domain-containing protein [Neoroseomonas nitratireducens]
MAAMGTEEILFVAARGAIAVLALVALVSVWASMRGATAMPASPRPLLVALVPLLGLAAAMQGFDAWDNVVRHHEQKILPSSWIWMLFDAAVPVLALIALRVTRERDAALARLSSMAVTDPLTGLANRRGFTDAAMAAIAACRRDGAPAALVMFDVDRFKSINDGHGHPAGDAVLVALADVLLRGARAGDITGRLGGEEFALLCPGLDAPGAAAVAERLRAALRAGVPHPAGGDAAVTASAGVAEIAVRGAPAGALDAALKAADEALYAAKAGGRDRVVVA